MTDQLRSAAQAVVESAQQDDDFDGQFIEWLVPDAVMTDLRDALDAAPPAGLREALAEIERLHELGRKGLLGPTGVMYGLTTAERALRAAIAAAYAGEGE